MSNTEKAGMLVNADGEVVGWVEAGTEMQEGDVLISHHKSAEKAGLLEQFTALKAENKPAKAKKEKAEGESKAPRQRVDIPETGKYRVLKPGYASAHTNPVCAETYNLLTGNTDLAVFFQNAKNFNHIKRDGTEGALVTPKAVVAYALRRGVIELA